MTQTETLKLAISRLEWFIDSYPHDITVSKEDFLRPFKEALAQPEQEPVAQWLEDAFREGWAACRDAEFVGEDEENWKFGNSTTNSRMIDLQQSHSPVPTAQPKEPEQEPVAWITQGGKGWLRWHNKNDDHLNKTSVPLYKHPKRKPLSDAEIALISAECSLRTPSDIYFARAIEAAHGIKG